MDTQRKEKLVTLFQAEAKLASTFGMQLSFDEKNRAIVRLPYNPKLDHALGGIHGGVIATLLDNAGWFTCAVAHEGDGWVATSEMSFHLLKPVKRDEIHARGEIIKAGRRQDIIEMRCYDSRGDLVAHGTGTFIYLDHLHVPGMGKS